LLKISNNSKKPLKTKSLLTKTKAVIGARICMLPESFYTDLKKLARMKK